MYLSISSFWTPIRLKSGYTKSLRPWPESTFGTSLKPMRHAPPRTLRPKCNGLFLVSKFSVPRWSEILILKQLAKLLPASTLTTFALLLLHSHLRAWIKLKSGMVLNTQSKSLMTSLSRSYIMSVKTLISTFLPKTSLFPKISMLMSWRLSRHSSSPSYSRTPNNSRFGTRRMIHSGLPRPVLRCSSRALLHTIPLQALPRQSYCWIFLMMRFSSSVTQLRLLVLPVPSVLLRKVLLSTLLDIMTSFMCCLRIFSKLSKVLRSRRPTLTFGKSALSDHTETTLSACLTLRAILILPIFSMRQLGLLKKRKPLLLEWLSKTLLSTQRNFCNMVVLKSELLATLAKRMPCKLLIVLLKFSSLCPSVLPRMLHWDHTSFQNRHYTTTLLNLRMKTILTHALSISSSAVCLLRSAPVLFLNYLLPLCMSLFSTSSVPKSSLVTLSSAASAPRAPRRVSVF